MAVLCCRPAVPLASPLRTGTVNGTYLEPAQRTASHHTSHVSFNRKQLQEAPGSPRQTSSEESNEDDDHPYAKIGTLTRSQPQESQGNDIEKYQRNDRPPGLGRKNFFDSDESGTNQNTKGASNLGDYDGNKEQNPRAGNLEVEVSRRM